jgi:hypothetical protein
LSRKGPVGQSLEVIDDDDDDTFLRAASLDHQRVSLIIDILG